jgi:hypothetical protein
MKRLISLFAAACLLLSLTGCSFFSSPIQNPVKFYYQREEYVYGQPDLGAEGTPADPETAAVWNAFLDSISFTYTGACQAGDSSLSRTASVTVLDIASVTEKLPERAQSLVNQKIASAENLTDVYDESGSFREELVIQILQQALQQCLTQDAETITREVTVKLNNRDGKWWVVPDSALLQALSGMA